MNFLISINSVPLASADVAPATGTPQYATSGNPVGPIPATVLPAYWVNAVMTEIVTAIEASGQTPSSTDWTQLAKAISQGGKNGQKLTSSGNFTVPAGVYWLDVELWGGGGGGLGATGSSGAAGGYERGFVSVTPGQIIPYTIGAAGQGWNGSSVTSGGSTTFLTLEATGGTAGGAGPGVGGIGSGGIYSMQGGPGMDLTDDGSYAQGSVGNAPGGNAPRGGLGGNVNAGGAGQPATAPGGGGGANAVNALYAQNGAQGWIIVRW